MHPVPILIGTTADEGTTGIRDAPAASIAEIRRRPASVGMAT
jgi:hypothetical protein